MLEAILIEEVRVALETAFENRMNDDWADGGKVVLAVQREIWVRESLICRIR